jgi:Leucine rich repeat
MTAAWKTDENKMDAAIVGPGFLDTLETIPEDVSVAAAALQHQTPHSVANFSTASAVASSDSGRDGIEVVAGEHRHKKIVAHQNGGTRSKRRGKRPRQGGGSAISATGAAIAGGDNASETHASLGGVGESLERLSPPSEEAPKRTATTSIFCTKLAVVFCMVVWLLLAVIGVGIYFIVAKVSKNNNNANSMVDSSSMQPTEDPIFPPYEFGPESLFPSAAPSYNQDDITDLDVVLRKISGVDAEKINDTNAPEGQCRHWMTHSDALELRVDQVGEKRVEQRYILCLFYYYTNGDSWTIKPWLNGELHECDWYGITCNANDVVGIELDNKNLTGTITDAIQSLSTIHLLRLQNNSVSGKIPKNIFDSLLDLKWLDLSNNALTGNIPAATDASSSSLEVLYLKGNQLAGTLPFFPNLQRVRAQRNLLTSMDEQYASAGRSLVYLYVYDNHLTGSLPPSWNTPNLQILDVGFNNLEGPIPQDLWDLVALRSLIVDNNRITGTLPLSSSSETLTQVWLNSNRLDGPVPTNFGENWANLTSLKLQDNDLTGSIAQDHCSRWPLSTSSTSSPFSESNGWEFETDCNAPTMECACCTQCFPARRKRHLRRAGASTRSDNGRDTWLKDDPVGPVKS